MLFVSLERCLDKLRHMAYNGPFVKYMSVNQIKDTPYPGGKVILHEVFDADGNLSPQSVQFTMVKILQIPDPRAMSLLPSPLHTFEVFLPSVMIQIPGCSPLRYFSLHASHAFICLINTII